MAISKKQLKLKLRMLLDRKPDYTQQGRLLGHLLIELGMNGGKSNNGTQLKILIAESLDELEAEGLVTLVKSGKVYHEVHRTKRQRAIPGSKTTKQAHQAPVVQLEKETPEVEATLEAAPIEEPVHDDEAAPFKGGIDIIREAVEAAEGFKAKLAEEVSAHEVTRGRNGELTAALAEQTRLREDAEANLVRYTETLQTANETIESLDETIAGLTEKLNEATSRSDIDELALRLDALRH